MKLPFYAIIFLWYFSILIFAYAFISLTPLKMNLKNYVLCYSLLIAITGLFSDCQMLANKPFENTLLISQEFPRHWSTRISIWDFLNLGKITQKVYNLYSLGNRDYQDTYNWSWNYEFPHIIGNSIYLVSWVFLFLNERRSFLISLLLGAIICSVNYTGYWSWVIKGLVNGNHESSREINKIISWIALDGPYTLFAGGYLLWYALTSLNEK